MVDLEKIRIFYYVALEGSLLKAAALLQLSSPSISKHVADLERQLNVKLLIRKKSGLKLTEAGEKLMAVAKHAIKDLEEASREIANVEAEKPTVLRIIATNGVSCFWFIGKLKKFIELNPKLLIKIYTTDEDVDFLNSKADVGLLPKVKDQEGVTMRKVKTFHIKLYASKDYLEKHGRPHSFADLENHRVLGFYLGHTGHRGNVDWHLKQTETRLVPAITINNAVAIFEAARQGLGIMSFISEFPYFEFSEFEEILIDHEPIVSESYFVTRAEQLDNVYIKQLYECLSEK